jgi:hypothetical protein
VLPTRELSAEDSFDVGRLDSIYAPSSEQDLFECSTRFLDDLVHKAQQALLSRDSKRLDYNLQA